MSELVQREPRQILTNCPCMSTDSLQLCATFQYMLQSQNKREAATSPRNSVAHSNHVFFTLYPFGDDKLLNICVKGVFIGTF